MIADTSTPGTSGATLVVCDGALAARLGALAEAEGRRVVVAPTPDRALEIMQDPSVACVLVDRPAGDVAAALLEARALKEAEVDALSYAISHDLRAPLRSVDGFSAALVEHAGEALDGKALDYLGRVRAAALRLSEMIEGLLAMHRLSRAQVSREDVDLSALATRVLAALAAAEPAREVTLAVEPGLTADVDRALVTRVLEELLGNSWKFTSKTPAPTIAFGATVTGGVTSYFVRDNGDGFDPAYSGTLFRPFQRFHRATDFPGRGLGLAFAARIVERHGGRVRAESASGAGATIHFTLPGAPAGGRE